LLMRVQSTLFLLRGCFPLAELPPPPSTERFSCAAAIWNSQMRCLSSISFGSLLFSSPLSRAGLLSVSVADLPFSDSAPGPTPLGHRSFKFVDGHCPLRSDRRFFPPPTMNRKPSALASYESRFLSTGAAAETVRDSLFLLRVLEPFFPFCEIVAFFWESSHGSRCDLLRELLPLSPFQRRCDSRSGDAFFSIRCGPGDDFLRLATRDFWLANRR